LGLTRYIESTVHWATIATGRQPHTTCLHVGSGLTFHLFKTLAGKVTNLKQEI